MPHNDGVMKNLDKHCLNSAAFDTLQKKVVADLTEIRFQLAKRADEIKAAIPTPMVDTPLGRFAFRIEAERSLNYNHSGNFKFVGTIDAPYDYNREWSYAGVTLKHVKFEITVLWDEAIWVRFCGEATDGTITTLRRQKLEACLTKVEARRVVLELMPFVEDAYLAQHIEDMRGNVNDYQVNCVRYNFEGAK